MIAYMFPGQGSQKVGMGADHFDLFPELVDEADAILGYSIRELCLENKEGLLDNTAFTQPALFTVNAIAYLNRIQETNTKPDYLLGHSLGEYNALHASGALSFSQGLRLVQMRGQFMSEAPEGAMAAILGITVERVRNLLSNCGLSAIDIANYNSLKQIVISGPVDEIREAEQAVSSEAMFYPLRTSGAFHSRQMQQAASAFSRELETYNFMKPEIPVISNVTALPYGVEEISVLLAKQVASPVRWYHSITYLLESGVDSFEELGPGDVMTKMVATIEREYQAGKVDELSAVKPVVESITQNAVEKTRTQSAVVEGSLEPENLVGHWNEKIDIGDNVVRVDNGSVFQTRSEAMLLFSARPVVYLKGFKGYFDLSTFEFANTVLNRQSK